MKLPADLVASLSPAYSGRRVCVTGGGGFIGGHLVDTLLTLPTESVTVIDDLSNASIDHLAEMMELEPERLRFVHASILDPIALTEAFHKVHTVFHLAAMGSVPASIAEPARAFAVNATGTVRVLEAARAAKVQRLVSSSSSSVYGESADAHAAKVETQLPAPISPYAASKLAAEAAVRAWSHSYGLSTLSLRYFNVIGPRQSADGPYAAVVPAFIKRALAGQPPIIYGDGRQSRDFTPVASVVAANLLAGASGQPLAGQALNIGTGISTSIVELANLISSAAGAPHLRPTLSNARAGDVRNSLADITAARTLIGYQPIGTVAEAIAATVQWFRQCLADSGSPS